MKIVENQTFYHIYREVSWNHSPMWKLGKTYFIGKEENPFIKYYDNVDCQYVHGDIQSMTEAIQYYQRYTREQIFEEVRREFFPNLPSRLRCLWVIKDDIDILKYWWELFGKSGLIMKVSLTGKIHTGSEEYLRISGKNFDFLRQQAFKYWAGTAGLNEIEQEAIFEGFVRVIEFVSPQSINY